MGNTQTASRTRLLGVLVLAAAAATGAHLLLGGSPVQSEPSFVEWQIAPGVRLDPATSTVPIVVHERDCPGEGRVAVTVRYRPNEVELDVGVRRANGIQACPAGPGTPYTVELDEPLGDRAVVGHGQRSPAAPS